MQNPLTLVMPIKSPEDREGLQVAIERLQSLPREENPIIQAFEALRTVHFARLVFLDDTRLALITTYDGDFDRYINDFVDHIGPVFDLLLQFMADPPPIPVQSHPHEFLDYVHRHDLGCLPPFYSAYPDRTVLDIRADELG
ncbi:hypothetical protein ACI78Z_00285 [Geodermatophilus sp. SYSU D01176]